MRTSFGVVSVASSNPPGTILAVFPAFNIALTPLLSAPHIPSNLKCNPKIGIINARLLIKVTAFVNPSYG